MTTTFDVLGPVRVLRDGSVVPLRSARVRDVLAVLLSHAPHAVSWERLVDEVWQDQSPVNPKAALQTCINRLRVAVGEDVVVTRPHGYALDVRPADLAAFDRLFAETQEADGADRIGPARAGLVLWRGPAYADSTTPSISFHEAPRLAERRLQLVDMLGEALLADDRHTEALALAEAEVVGAPTRESLWSLRIRALAALGRRRDALEAHDRYARRLAEEEGLDPSPELGDLRQRVLIDDPTVARPTTRTVGWTVHEQLPLDVPGFVARAADVDHVSALLRDPTVPVVVLNGMGGVGKSSLAVHVAHRLREDFPDGQWFFELRGSRAGTRSPSDVLVDLLRLAGVEDAGIPSHDGARESLLRGRLAGRRLLLVLDDARDAEQVRPLLPGTPETTAVLVTSRAVLDGLVALDDAEQHAVQPLDAHDAHQLLSQALRSRTGLAEHDPAHLDALVHACAGLPLALRIVSANVRTTGDPERVLADLRDETSMDALRIPGDERAGVDAVFSGTYLAFDDDHRRCLRLVAHLPGDDFSPPSVAALLDADDGSATLMLRRLSDHNLLQHTRPGRYRVHDLVRRFALALGDTEAVPALERYMRWTLERCVEATSRHHAVVSGLPRPPIERRAFADDASGRRWLEAERTTLVAAALHAAEDPRLCSYAWHLTDVLRLYLYMSGRQRDCQRMATAALDAARRDGDRVAEAVMLLALCSAIDSLGDQHEALRLGRQSLELLEPVGDHTLSASVHNQIGIAHMGLGDARAARESFERSIEHYRRGPRPGLSAVPMSNLAFALVVTGDLIEAESVLVEGLTIDRAADRTVGIVAKLIALGEVRRLLGRFEESAQALSEAESWIMVVSSEGFHTQALRYGLSSLHLSRGRPDLAIAEAERAEAKAQRAGDPWELGQSLKALAHAHAASGHRDLADRTYRAAREVSTSHGYQHMTLEIALAHAGLRAVHDPEALAELTWVRERARDEGRRVLEADALATLLSLAPTHHDEPALATRLQELVRATGHLPHDWSCGGTMGGSG